MSGAGWWMRFKGQPIGRVAVRLAVVLVYMPLLAWLLIEVLNPQPPFAGIDTAFLAYSLLFGGNLDLTGFIFLALWSTEFLLLLVFQGRSLGKKGLLLQVKVNQVLIFLGVCLGGLQYVLSGIPWPLLYFFIYLPGIGLLGYFLNKEFARLPAIRHERNTEHYGQE
ncbi:MAG: hypothetical protein RLZZ626_1165 [Actinomycetota bacterium]|jgi:hypothetical protein